MADNPNPAKVAVVDEIREKLSDSTAVIVTEYRGLDVPAQAQLRAKISEAGGEFKIYKNTLARRAAESAGVDIGEHLTGPTALAFARPQGDTPADPVALSKALQDFSNDNEMLVIKGGIMDDAPIGADDVKALSKLPSRETMLAQFAGLLQAPMSKFAGLLQAMPQNFAGLVKALIEKGGTGAGEGEAPAEEAGSDDAAAEEAPADDAPAEEPAAEAAEENAEEAAGDDAAAEATDSAADDAAEDAGGDDAAGEEETAEETTES